MEKRRRRGQAALEFLMTYSWAILVVIIVIGALAYFGVLDPTNLIPQTCKLEAGFNCADYRVAAVGTGGTTANITVLLQNGIGRPVTVTGITYTTVTGTTCEWSGSQTIANGAIGSAMATSNTCTVSNPDKKNRYVMLINYTYADVPSALPQQMQGEIFARAQ